jgi:hypothetical protein
MPYITKEKKDLINYSGFENIFNCGELNYFFTLCCLGYIKNKGKSYQTINDIIGALECCKQEFYRRLVAPYENTKIQANGDVY